MDNIVDNNADNYAYAKDNIGTAKSVRIITDLIADRDISDPEAMNRLIQAQINYIADEIYSAIHIGQYHVTISMDVRWEVRDMLMKLGYRVNTFKYPDPAENTFTQEYVWIGW